MVQSVKEELVKVVQILWRAHTCPSCHNLNTICLHPALIDFPLALFRFLFPLFPFTLFIFFPSLFSSLCSPFPDIFFLSLSLHQPWWALETIPPSPPSPPFLFQVRCRHVIMYFFRFKVTGPNVVSLKCVQVWGGEWSSSGYCCFFSTPHLNNNKRG